MKKTFLITVAVVALFVSGCSSTWQGIKSDSSKAWNDTKHAIHDATAD